LKHTPPQCSKARAESEQLGTLHSLLRKLYEYLRRYQEQFEKQPLDSSIASQLEALEAVVAHLSQYEQSLKNRGQCRYGRRGEQFIADYPGQHHWLELDNNPHDEYLAEFEKEKVVWQELAQGSQFAFDGKGRFFVSNTAYIMTGTHLRYLLGYLNSRLNEITLHIVVGTVQS
jgi:hypothetical protein